MPKGDEACKHFGGAFLAFFLTGAMPLSENPLCEGRFSWECALSGGSNTIAKIRLEEQTPKKPLKTSEKPNPTPSLSTSQLGALCLAFITVSSSFLYESHFFGKIMLCALPLFLFAFQRV